MWVIVGCILALVILLLLLVWWKPGIISYLFTVSNCTTDADCNAGYKCMGPSSGPNFCIRQDCSVGGTACPNGTTCQETPEGLTCLPPPPPPPPSCTDNTQCAGGTLCFNGQCLPVNQPCSGTFCQDVGRCSNGECIQCDASNSNYYCLNVFPNGGTYTCVPLQVGVVSGECLQNTDPRMNNDCTVDSDCTDPVINKCNQGQCAVCGQSSDCVGWYGAGSVCQDGFCINGPN